MSHWAQASLASPLGELQLFADDGGLRRVLLPGEVSDASSGSKSGLVSVQCQQVLAQAQAQLQAYFDGSLRQFTLPLAAKGTAFQQRVWQVLGDLPFGTTCSYGELARRIGQPQAARAVGAALGRNPLPIVVPCHRVLGADGRLTGFSGGVDSKQWLLAHEADRT